MLDPIEMSSVAKIVKLCLIYTVIYITSAVTFLFRISCSSMKKCTKETYQKKFIYIIFFSEKMAILYNPSSL